MELEYLSLSAHIQGKQAFFTLRRYIINRALLLPELHAVVPLQMRISGGVRSRPVSRCRGAIVFIRQPSGD